VQEREQRKWQVGGGAKRMDEGSVSPKAAGPPGLAAAPATGGAATGGGGGEGQGCRVPRCLEKPSSSPRSHRGAVTAACGATRGAACSRAKRQSLLKTESAKTRIPEASTCSAGVYKARACKATAFHTLKREAHHSAAGDSDNAGPRGDRCPSSRGRRAGGRAATSQKSTGSS